MSTFADIAELAERMAATASRLKKRAEVAAAITRAHEGAAGQVRLFCLYLAGLPFAAADTRKLNAGGALLTKALLTVTGASDAALTAAYRRHGDLGAAAFDLMTEQGNVRAGGIPLDAVAEAFAGMATARTTAIRAALVEGLLRSASPLEAKYLLKLMLGDMRIGVKESLVEEAIATAAGADVAQVRHAVMLEADLGYAAERAFAGTLHEARMTLFHPLGFMLASPVESPEEAIARFTAKPAKVVAEKKPKRRKKGGSDLDSEPELDEVMQEAMGNDIAATLLSGEEVVVCEAASVQAFLEDKYDGMRAQIHFGAADDPERVAIYSRNREDITESFPELVEAFQSVPVTSDSAVILDGEILGWNFRTGQALPFAVMGQRIGRKRVGNDIRTQVPVIFMAFDLMFAMGDLLLQLPLRERRNRLELLAEKLVDHAQSPLIFTPKPEQAGLFAEASTSAAPRLARLMLSPSKLVESAEEIDRAYADARARANEGVMLKAADSAYQPGRRGLAWVKLKRELATLDVVITGAEYGSGRRSQFLSDYTFAVRDAEGELQNVGKAYSGVTDAEVTELTEFLKAHTLEDHGHFRTVEPLVILEVAFNNVMRSDRHSSGFALRFPRILRIRTDKPLAEIDTVARVEEVYQSQVDKPAEE